MSKASRECKEYIKDYNRWIRDAAKQSLRREMTLEELARELRKIFRFRYLTAADYKHEGPICVDLWEYKPQFHESDCTWNGLHRRELLYSFDMAQLACTIDLSEYKDADGNIDYGKCIVEVE